MVNRAAGALLDGLFPNYCRLCGLRSDSPLPLCRACRGDLQANDPCCLRCAIPLPATPIREHPALCGKCLTSPPPFHRVHAPWLYTDHLRHLIHCWKYHGERRLTPLLATLWQEQAHNPGPVDLMVPVPLHWRRLWQRGFNQSELLCRALHQSNTSFADCQLAPRAVLRHRATTAQSGMDALQRQRNVKGAFTSSRPCENLRIAVVDDVLTTGATAAAIAKALRDAGAAHIEVWCVARTPAPAD